MDSFSKTNLQNILDIFESKTGVKPLNEQRQFKPMKIASTIAVVILCFLMLTAFTVVRFSSLSGDELSLSASYEGNGIVLIEVENRSDKDLEFQPKMKLMLWSTGEEIAPVTENIEFNGTGIKANSKGVLTIDISKAYDVEQLEKPLNDDNYYFILTNNNFAFGQDWICTVEFAETVNTTEVLVTPMTPSEADKKLVSEVDESLKPYFDRYVTDPVERGQSAYEYLEKCAKVIEKAGSRVVPSVSPMLIVDCMEPEVVFDDTVPLETQHQLTGQQWHTLDGYGIPVGASDSESALVISAYVPQHKGDNDGGVEIPLVYIFTYEVSNIMSMQDCAFIHGRIITFEELEQYKVYEDEQYVCYEVSELFYTDLRAHVESMLSQRTDVYFDEQIWNRVENIYNYYTDKNVLSSRFFYVEVN